MRIKHIDILRGLAASFVALFHLTLSSDVHINSFNYTEYGWVGVQIFFVVSGFILPYSLYKADYNKKSFFTFIIKRSIRIYPAYMATIAIGLTLAIITKRSLIPPAAFFSQLLFLNDILGMPSMSPVFWTLAIEFQFYFILGWLFPYFSKSNSHSILFIFVLTLSAFLVKEKSLIFFWLPFFSIGVLTFNKTLTNLSHKSFWFTLASLLLVIILVHGIPQAIASLLAALFILYGNYKTENRLIKILLFLGSISYSFYLIHWDLGRAVVRLSRYIPVINEFNFLRITVGFIASIICAWLLYICIEKRSIKLSANLKYKNYKK